MTRYEKDPAKNTYSWVYTGGCYKNSEPVWYQWAEPDVTYNFHDIKFEVRQDNREVIPQDDEETENDEIADDDDNQDGKNKTESPK